MFQEDHDHPESWERDRDSDRGWLLRPGHKEGQVQASGQVHDCREGQRDQDNTREEITSPSTVRAQEREIL